jgi:hypothetical protein
MFSQGRIQMNRVVSIVVAIVAIAFLKIGNAEWIQMNGPGGGSVYALAKNNANIFAGTGGAGIFMSTNNGADWNAINSGLPNSKEITSLCCYGNKIFAGVWNSGVFLSTNNGAGWTDVNPNLAEKTIKRLAIIGTNIFAVSNDGIWRRQLSEMVGVTEQNIRQRFLANGYFEVAPFSRINPSLNIRFFLTHSENVAFYIFDLSGRKIASLVNKYCKTGNNIVTLRLNESGVGVYIMKMQIGSSKYISSFSVMR